MNAVKNKKKVKKNDTSLKLIIYFCKKLIITVTKF